MKMGYQFYWLVMVLAMMFCPPPASTAQFYQYIQQNQSATIDSILNYEYIQEAELNEEQYQQMMNMMKMMKILNFVNRFITFKQKAPQQVQQNFSKLIAQQNTPEPASTQTYEVDTAFGQSFKLLCFVQSEKYEIQASLYNNGHMHIYLQLFDDYFSQAYEANLNQSYVSALQEQKKLYGKICKGQYIIDLPITKLQSAILTVNADQQNFILSVELRKLANDINQTLNTQPQMELLNTQPFSECIWQLNIERLSKNQQISTTLQLNWQQYKFLILFVLSICGLICIVWNSIWIYKAFHCYLDNMQKITTTNQKLKLFSVPKQLTFNNNIITKIANSDWTNFIIDPELLNRTNIKIKVNRMSKWPIFIGLAEKSGVKTSKLILYGSDGSFQCNNQLKLGQGLGFKMGQNVSISIDDCFIKWSVQQQIMYAIDRGCLTTNCWSIAIKMRGLNDQVQIK